MYFSSKKCTSNALPTCYLYSFIHSYTFIYFEIILCFIVTSHIVSISFIFPINVQLLQMQVFYAISFKTRTEINYLLTRQYNWQLTNKLIN